MRTLKKIIGFCFGVGVVCHSLTEVKAQEVQTEVEQLESDSDTIMLVASTDLVPEIEEHIGGISSFMLKERFKHLEKTIPLVYHEESHKYVEYFVHRKPEFTRRMLEQKDLYFPIYEKILAEHNMPDELKYLSLIESGLNPRILSRVGAGGLWQFMRATGREFGLKQDQFIDERFDPVKSTVAAAKYMRQLYKIFGDWEMVLASYNCGPGNIRRAIRKTGKQNFWGIYSALPKETRNYVPQYVAMVYMMKYAEEHGISAIEPKFAIATDTIHVNGFIDLTTFASLSGVTMDEIRENNPQIINSYLPAYTRDVVLKLPSEKMAMLGDNLVAVRDSASKESALKGALLEEDEYNTHRITHTVRKGETLSTIARKYKVTIPQLKAWNKIKKNTIVKGQRLAIQKIAKAPRVVEPNLIVKNAANTSENQNSNFVRTVSNHSEAVVDSDQGEEEEETKVTKPRFHTIKRGENLAVISKKYGLTVQQLKNLNGLKSNSLVAGKQLKVGVTETVIARKNTPVKPTQVTQEVVKAEPVRKAVAQEQEVNEEDEKVKRARIIRVDDASIIGNMRTKPTVVSKKKEVAKPITQEVEVEEEEEGEGIVEEIKKETPVVNTPVAYHTIRKGENLAIIAKKYGMTIDELKDLNNMNSTRLTAGNKLKVGAEKVATKATSTTKSAKSTKESYHVVKKGDTLWDIAQKYDVSVDKIRKVNNLRGNGLRLGMKILISG